MRKDISHKILVITQYYPPDITAAAFRIKETAEILTLHNHKVTIITAEPHKSKLVADSYSKGLEADIIRTPIFKYKNGGKLNYLLHYASFMFAAIFSGIFSRAGNVDVVLATSPPLFVGIAGYLLAKFKHALFVFDVRDIWPDSAVSAGQLSAGGLLFRLAKKVEVWLYRNANLVTCVAEPMADYIRTYTDKVLVVYNGVPARYCSIEPSKHNRISEAMTPDKINVAYVGNMGRCQDVGLIVRAALELKGEGKDNIRFFLIGDGVERSQLEQIAKEHGLNNVIIDGPVRKTEAFEIMLNATALFLQLKADATLEKTIPSKVFDYLAVGKPILYGIEGEGRQILEKTQGNLYFQPGSLPSFLESLKAFERDCDVMSLNARKNRTMVNQYYTREKMVERLEEALLEEAH